MLYYVVLRYITLYYYGMHTRSSDENSVCLSDKRVICDKTVSLRCVDVSENETDVTYD